MKVHLSEMPKATRRGYLKYVGGLVVVAVVAAVGYSWMAPKEASYQIVITGQTIALPKSKTSGFMSVEEAIARRRSIREYALEPLSLEEVSQLLWAAQGITEAASGKRAAPSAGMTYPLEIYLAVGERGVKDLPVGVYKYIPQNHTITKMLDEDVRYPLQEAALRQTWVGEAPVTIVIAAIHENTTLRYGDRGIRYVHIEAGHVAENLFLQSVALSLGTVPIGAFNDDDVQKALGLAEEFKPIYIMPVGRV
jgi:SagB-type dehydrogenase family enzyme